jgi:hypothetical protein
MPKPSQDNRQGGREGENPDAASPSAEKPPSTLIPPRNSSGNASHAASLLDLRQKVNLHQRALLELARLMGCTSFVDELTREQQRGFRRGR